MQTITITQKDIEKYKVQNSESGYIIDELAYAAGEWTSGEMHDNNLEYEPNEPYAWNFEKDLFEHTKTSTELYELARRLGCSLNANWGRLSKEQGLQAGACVALNNPDEWHTLLTEWSTAVMNQDAYSKDIYSQEYADQLDKERECFQDDLYKGWLNGDYRESGVVDAIAKYFTDERDGTWNAKEDEYTFVLNDEDIEKYTDRGYKKNQMKRALLEDIKDSSNARKEKDRRDREARRSEYERTKAYKEERKRQEEDERKEKLLAMKL